MVYFCIGKSEQVMISRKIYKFLHDFFTNDKKALLVTGARQIGKTYSIRHVGNQDFEVFVDALVKVDTEG